MFRCQPLRTPETIINTILGLPTIILKMMAKGMDAEKLKDETYNRLSAAVSAGDFAYPLEDDNILHAFILSLIITIIADAPALRDRAIHAVDSYLIHAEVDAEQLEREIEILRITQHIKPGIKREVATLWLRGIPLADIALKLDRTESIVIRRFDEAMESIRERFGNKQALYASIG